MDYPFKFHLNILAHIIYKKHLYTPEKIRKKDENRGFSGD